MFCLIVLTLRILVMIIVSCGSVGEETSMLILFVMYSKLVYAEPQKCD